MPTQGSLCAHAPRQTPHSPGIAAQVPARKYHFRHGFDTQSTGLSPSPATPDQQGLARVLQSNPYAHADSPPDAITVIPVPLCRYEPGSSATWRAVGDLADSAERFGLRHLPEAYPHPEAPGHFVVRDAALLKMARAYGWETLRCRLAEAPPVKAVLLPAPLPQTLLGKVWRRVLAGADGAVGTGEADVPPAGDALAWGEPYRRVTRMMWKVLLELGMHPGLIDDFIHRLLLKWLMRLGPRGPLLPKVAYLRTATCREGLRYLERAARRAGRQKPGDGDAITDPAARAAGRARGPGRRPRQVPMPEEEPRSRALTPLEEDVRREVTVEVLWAVANLPDRERDAVTLRDLEGRGAAEAAALLGVSPPTVSANRGRALLRLRGSLAWSARAAPPPPGESREPRANSPGEGAS